ncbi:MAG: hypothetical protein ABI375_06045 [Rudaea sp.]
MLSFSSGTALAKPHDLICANLAAFASAAIAGESHSVVLRGGWGGDAKGTIMTHDCQHSGYEPGKKLCIYLLPNSSWEFGAHNAGRALACLDSGDTKRFREQLSSFKSSAVITSSLKLLKDKQALITLRFEPPSSKATSSVGISTLTITAARATN